MAFGPGKYDELCTHAAEQTGIVNSGGGVLLIVLGGNRGSGFSCTADLPTTVLLPDILEEVARQLRTDANGLGRTT